MQPYGKTDISYKEGYREKIGKEAFECLKFNGEG